MLDTRSPAVIRAWAFVHAMPAFRERIDERSGQRRGYAEDSRYPDRYLAVSRHMSGRHVRTTFEEDIKAPFHGLYSHSGSQGIRPQQGLEQAEPSAKTVSRPAEKLDHCDDSQAITAVEDRTWRELVLTGADFRICKSPKVETECALIVWYDARSNPHRPEVVEFSFRYGDDQEAYGDKSARGARMKSSKSCKVQRLLLGPIRRA